MKTSSPSPSPRNRTDHLAASLGWFSIGLGLAEILAPKAIARLIGVRPHRLLLTALGMREVASGIGILTDTRPARWLWSRVAGDVMDLALLGSALHSPDSDDARLESVIGAVVGVTALDIAAARRQSAHPKGVSEKIHVIRSITIQRSPSEVYAFWRQLENLPRFMRNVIAVEQVDRIHSHWVVKAIGGMKVEWDAEIFQEEPDQLLSWRTTPGAGIEHAGTVRFEPAAGQRGTVVRVNLMYHQPGGKIGAAAASLLGEAPEQKVRGDLYRLKQLLETGEIPTTQGQSAGASQTTPTWVDDPQGTGGSTANPQR